MKRALFLLCLATGSLTACIAPSVVAPEDRDLFFHQEELEWTAASASDLPGTYVSVKLEGQVAAVLLKLVYRFDGNGHYSGAALFDGEPPHFEVLTGTWQMTDDRLQLDDGAAAALSVDVNGSLRLVGEEGSVILRKERAL